MLDTWCWEKNHFAKRRLNSLIFSSMSLFSKEQVAARSSDSACDLRATLTVDHLATKPEKILTAYMVSWQLQIKKREDQLLQFSHLVMSAKPQKHMQYEKQNLIRLFVRNPRPWNVYPWKKKRNTGNETNYSFSRKKPSTVQDLLRNMRIRINMKTVLIDAQRALTDIYFFTYQSRRMLS